MNSERKDEYKDKHEDERKQIERYVQDQLRPLRAQIAVLENVNVLLQNKIESYGNFYNIIYRYNQVLIKNLDDLIKKRNKIDSDIAELESGLDVFLNEHKCLNDYKNKLKILKTNMFITSADDLVHLYKCISDFEEKIKYIKLILINGMKIKQLLFH